MKFEGSIKEILDFLESTGAVPKLKEKMAGALLAIAESEEIKQHITTMIKQQAQTQVREVVRDALFMKDGGWNKPKVLSGWYADDFKKLFAEVLQKDNLRSLIWDVVTEQSKELDLKFKKLESEIMPHVDTKVKALIPGYVTEEYRERVATHFDDTKLESIVVELIQKSFGRMFMGGLLSDKS